MATIENSKAELEKSLARVLAAVLPQTEGYSLEIDIIENGRKKRSDASLESWRPAAGEIRIRFGRPLYGVPGDERRPRMAIAEASAAFAVLDRPARESDSWAELAGVVARSEIAPAGSRTELIRALHAAERRPGFDFVALKWFRDLYLPARAPWEWATSRERDELIREAVNDQAFLTYKVPNPKAPAFPVTAIRLNRRHPDVAAVLAAEGEGALDFGPVAIRGEPLSATVVRERR